MDQQKASTLNPQSAIKTSYALDLWQQQSWQRTRDGRCYQAELRQNLFGEWIVVREWWGTASRRRGHMEDCCDSFEMGQQQFAMVEKCRARRGYVIDGPDFNA